MLATNLRFIKNVNGQFLSKQSLCASCGAINCDLRRDAQHELSVTGQSQCILYIPTLKFRPPIIGLQGNFCTFRSKSWATAVQPGNVIKLVHAGTGGSLGRAQVTAVYAGPKLDMERTHGPNNHLMVGRPFDLLYFQGLRKKYSGNRIYTNNTTLSAIYLKVIS